MDFLLTFKNLKRNIDMIKGEIGLKGMHVWFRLFDLNSLRPINHLSVRQGRVFPG